MKHSHFSRRAFIKTAGIAGGLSLFELSVSGQVVKDFIFRRRCRDAGAIVRKNFKNLWLLVKGVNVDKWDQHVHSAETRGRVGSPVVDRYRAQG